MTSFTPDQLAAALAALGINGNCAYFGPPPATSTAVNAPSDGPPATTVNISPAGPANASHNIAPVQNTQSAATAPVAGPSFQATVGPDGPWYAITKGHTVGVYHGWTNITHLVTGVGRACYFRYLTQAAVLAAFNEAVQAGAVEILYVYVPLTLSFHTCRHRMLSHYPLSLLPGRILKNMYAIEIKKAPPRLSTAIKYGMKVIVYVLEQEVMPIMLRATINQKNTHQELILVHLICERLVSLLVRECVACQTVSSQHRHIPSLPSFFPRVWLESIPEKSIVPIGRLIHTFQTSSEYDLVS
ncbi:hypothetical protein EDD18DRAFT_1114103 [Armillaria luteobubalina]|uniref:Ribonuclease H1 N-terminal domain-containing protein n=1 Tax=Armillaria luteobubalina TaxID=153913 RepID=A0AA39P741_9AGAR|nr:hypothetical protein EDD18DRAFT_1114103 [Armillaria luteobubalina]